MLLLVVLFWMLFLICIYVFKIIFDLNGYLVNDLGFNVFYMWKVVGIGFVYNYLLFFILLVFVLFE